MGTWQQLLDLQQGTATRRQLLSAGLSRRDLDRGLAAGTLRRAAPGLYEDRPRPPRGRHLLSGGQVDLGYLAEVRTALLRVGPGGCARGRTAAVLWGFDLAVEPRVLELQVPHGRRPAVQEGVVVRQARGGTPVLLRPHALAPVAVTSAVDTVLACAEELPLAEAVVVADSAMRTGAVTRAGLRRAVSSRRGRPFAGRLWRVLRWSDERSGSVLESLLRVLLCSAGLRPPRTQHRLVDTAGRLLARVDLAWPAHRLVVEADGRRWHDPADARDVDRWRDNTCARLGWRVLRFTWADVVHRPEAVVAVVREALGSADVRTGSTAPALVPLDPRGAPVLARTQRVPSPGAGPAVGTSAPSPEGAEGSRPSLRTA